MVSIRSFQTSKFGILMIIIGVMIGTVSGISWNSPSDEEAFQNSFDVNVNASDVGGSIDRVALLVMEPDEDSFSELYDLNAGSGDNYTEKVERNQDFNGTQGDYKFRSKAYNGSGPNLTTSDIEVSLDAKGPTFNEFSPSNGAFVNGDDGDGESIDVSYSSSDDYSHTSVDYENISIRDEDIDSDGTELDDISLDDEEYTVETWANDSLGNSNSDTWSFTVDTSYDGDTDPTFSPADEIFVMEDEDEDQSIDVTLEEKDEGTDIQVKCFDGNNDEFDSTDFKEVDGDTAFTCELEADEYGGQKVDVYAEVCDEAGNCQSLSDETKTYYLDANPPNVNSLKTSSGASAFNSEFKIDLVVRDDASGVQEVEYYFNKDTEEGEGTLFEYSLGKDTYSVDPSNLESGEKKNLYVRAKDEAGRWSDSYALEFDYYPDKDPSISVSTPDNITVTAGKSKTFELAVKNTGEFYLPTVQLNISNKIINKEKTLEKLTREESGSTTVEIETEESDIGSHQINVSSTNPRFNKGFELIVEANKDQRDRIDKNLSDYREKLDSLESNVTELNSSGLSEDLSERIDSNLTDFRDNVQDAEEAVENGNYYRADSILERIESAHSTASKSFKQVKKDHREAQQKRWMMIGLVFLVMIGAGATGYFVYRDDYGVDLEKVADSDIDISRFSDIPNRVRSIFKEESEAEEFEWEGFND